MDAAVQAAVLKAGPSNRGVESGDGRLPRLEAGRCFWSRADRLNAVYLRAAQAYMLISMPTGTSTIFGAFQAIRFSQVLARCGAKAKVKATSNIAQVFTLWLCVARGLRLTRSELHQ